MMQVTESQVTFPGRLLLQCEGRRTFALRNLPMKVDGGGPCCQLEVLCALCKAKMIKAQGIESIQETSVSDYALKVLNAQ